MKKILFLAAAAVFLAACSDDSGPETPRTQVISFEKDERMTDIPGKKEVALGDLTISLLDGGTYTYRHVFTAKPYAVEADFDGPLFATADSKIAFRSYYASAWDAWGGIAISTLTDRTEAAPALVQQFSVWADGGAEGSETFAVFYDSNSPTEAYPEYLTRSGYPTIELTQARRFEYLYLANSTWVHNYFKGAESDSFQVEITGWRDGATTGTLTETLVAGTSKLDGWRKVDLTSLGRVDKLEFRTRCNVLADPTYFCVDRIAIEAE